jgi:glycine/D-amino acid oxidase-like deaminating enzyme
MKVQKLPNDPGATGWNRILPPQINYPELETPQHCDSLIIGAGFAGLAAARRIQQLKPGGKIILVEARRIAQGPAGRNTGFMIDLPHDLASGNYGGDQRHDLNQIKFNRAGIAFAAEAAEDYAMPSEAFSKSGKINAAASTTGLQQNSDYASYLDALNEAHEFLDQQEMKSLTGSDYYRGGLYTPGTAMIQPALFVRSTAQGLSKHVSIYENSPIVSLQKMGAAWHAKTPRGRIDANTVILAVNGHLESFGFFQRRLMHVFTYASMTRILTTDELRALGGEPQWACTPADPMGTTVRRITGTGGARIVIRNRFTYDPGMEVSDKRIENISREHQRAFKNRFPLLDRVNMEYQWGGRLCLSRNNVSAFGELETGLFAACCQNGLGVAKGTASGKLAAELAYGHGSDLLSNILQQEKPVKLPPEPFTWIGVNAAMRWGEFRAGAEL